MNLEADVSVEGILNHRDTWSTVARALARHDMPPPDAAPLDDGKRKEFVDFLNRLLNELSCSSEIHPGAVTIRRLNHTEYRNTVRDLFGVDYAAADAFPGDDVGYGFDNIGDVLALPPILLERYFKAAEEISSQAITNLQSIHMDKMLSGLDLPEVKGLRQAIDSMIFYQNASSSLSLDFPAAGQYTIGIWAAGQQAGDEPVKMKVLIDDHAVQQFDIEKPKQVSVDVDFEPGTHKIGCEFINDYFDKAHPAALNNDRNLIVQLIHVSGPNSISAQDLSASEQRLMFVKPGDGLSNEQAARKLIERWALWAFRRPPREEEIDQLLKLFGEAAQNDESFEGCMQIVLQAILVSPNFLYKVELPLPADGSRRALNDWELASALSYFLWSSAPDDALLEAARSGALSTADGYRQQIERMLDDPKAQNLVDNFAIQWLQLRRLDRAAPNPEKFPNFDDPLRHDMLTETQLTVQHVIETNAPITQLLDSKVSFVNGRLAKLYGIPGVDGDDFRQVDVASEHRGGLLTQASVLTATSNPSRTSPVKRGKWIMENLLGQTPPPPDPAAMPLDQQHELTGTLRERMEQHRRNPSCASCHARMDPLGFALEHYDAIGRWRDKDDGQPVDSSAKLPNGTEFDGAAELQQLLSGAMSRQFVRCFIERLMTFALGRGLDYRDHCVVDQILADVAQDDNRFRSIVLAICNSEPFRFRQKTGE